MSTLAGSLHGDLSKLMESLSQGLLRPQSDVLMWHLLPAAPCASYLS